MRIKNTNPLWPNAEPPFTSIPWRPLERGWYGNSSRYIKFTNLRTGRHFYLRNPYAKALLHNGKKGR